MGTGAKGGLTGRDVSGNGAIRGARQNPLGAGKVQATSSDSPSSLEAAMRLTFSLLSSLPYFLPKTVHGRFAGADPDTTTSAREKR